MKNNQNRIEKVVIDDGNIKVELHEDGLYRLYTKGNHIGLMFVGYGEYTLGCIVEIINKFKKNGWVPSLEAELWLAKNK